jgi:Tol biopolymer transport system component
MIEALIGALFLPFATFATADTVAIPPPTLPSLSAKTAKSSCQHIGYDGLGIRPTGRHSLPFGRGLITLSDKSGRVVAISPDGGELFFSQLGPTGPQIMRSAFYEGRWQKAEPAPFSNVGINTEPSFSPDGSTLYFVSNRPPSQGTDIWKVERSGGGWGEPERLGEAVNGPGNEWHPQAAGNGDIYFAADDRSDGRGQADLYVSKFANERYSAAQNLGASINTPAAEWDAYVNPAGNRLVFKSNRPGGHGGMDMYVSKLEGGSWSQPRNAGAAVNTADDDDSGDVTPDGRFVIFARSKPRVHFWSM